MKFIISIDPGNHKCGVILADKINKVIVDGRIVKTKYVTYLVDLWSQKYFIDLIIIGNGTSSNNLISNLKNNKIPLKKVNEKNSTLLARDRYWEIWPKPMYLKFLPKGMIIPKEKNLDAIAALVLLENFMKYKFLWESDNKFKSWP
tara:strand:- start:638 stop:1075 length:438 start_codon:yes stop_codon:yes gene_type:complete